MIKPIMEVERENHSQARILYNLIAKKKIKAYTVDGEHLAFDTKEYDNYKKGCHRGRPPKTVMIRKK